LRAEALEAVVRTITFTRRSEVLEDNPDLSSAQLNARCGTVVASQLSARSWNAMALPGCAGRYVPDTEASQLAAAIQPRPAEMFEQWLRRVTTTAVDTEVNVQFGEFTLKKHAVRSLDHRLRRLPDFVDIFGPPSSEQHLFGALYNFNLNSFRSAPREHNLFLLPIEI
jgi:hypothetical protein